VGSKYKPLGLPATTMRDIAIRSLEQCRPSQKLLLFVLNSYCGAHPFCTPSTNSLCRDTGLSRRTLFDVLRSLRTLPDDPHYPDRLRRRYPPVGLLIVKRFPSISRSGKLAWRNQYVLDLGSRSSTISVGSVIATSVSAVVATSGSAKKGGKGAVVATSVGAVCDTRRESCLREHKEESTLIDFWKRSDTDHGRLWSKVLQGLLDSGIPLNTIMMCFVSAEPLRMDGDTLTVLLPPLWFSYVVTHYHNVIPDFVNLVSFDPDKIKEEKPIPAEKPKPLYPHLPKPLREVMVGAQESHEALKKEKRRAKKS